MASLRSFSSSSPNTRHTIRSISLPARSHHTTLQVDEEVTSLRTWEASMPCIPDAETCCSGIASLERLYTCVDNLLSLPLTQQALSHYQHGKLVDELLVRSLRLLDTCGSVREVVSQVKGHVRDIQSALRRRKDDLSIDVPFLKKLKKDAKRAIADLKHVDHIYGSERLNVDHHLSSVIRVLRDASEVSISVFGLLLSFLFVSTWRLKSTSSKWSILSKLVRKGTTGSKYPQICVDDLGCHVENIENGLASMFRRLIRTRASLLNIQTH